MADYNEREMNKEIKYLRRVLGEVDSQIPVPDSVRGDALRRKLDAIQPPAPAEPDRKSGVTFGLRWFSWQSGVTYAAAFALIVGLFYGFGFHRQPDIVEGTIEPDSAEVAPFAAQFDFALDDAVDIEEFAVTDESVGTPTPRSEATGGAQDGEASTFGDLGEAILGGVGGSSKSAMMGAQEGYTYTWRNNDASDPDKGAYPVTVEIVDNKSAQVAAQIDIPDMNAVAEFYFSDDTLTLVGGGSGEVVLRSYDISVPREPLERTVLTQPGTFVDSNLHDNIVHVFSYVEDAATVDCPTEVLPHDPSNESACVVTALDVAGGESAQKAFVGASNDVTLYNERAYVSYEAALEEEPEEPEVTSGEQSRETSGEPDDGEADADQGDEEDETSLYVAQIRLDGLEMSVGAVS